MIACPDQRRAVGNEWGSRQPKRERVLGTAAVREKRLRCVSNLLAFLGVPPSVVILDAGLPVTVRVAQLATSSESRVEARGWASRSPDAAKEAATPIIGEALALLCVAFRAIEQMAPFVKEDGPNTIAAARLVDAPEPHRIVHDLRRAHEGARVVVALQLRHMDPSLKEICQLMTNVHR